MATIGLFRFEDFIAEAADFSGPVRLQMYHKSESANFGLSYLRFFVEVAAVTATGNILVFRLTVGGGTFMLPEEREKVERLKARGESWLVALRTYLVSYGYEVRPGLIAATTESKTQGELPAFLVEEKEAVHE